MSDYLTVLRVAVERCAQAAHDRDGREPATVNAGDLALLVGFAMGVVAERERFTAQLDPEARDPEPV